MLMIYSFFLTIPNATSCCLFVWDLSSHLRIFHSYEDVTIPVERLQIWTYARHSRTLSCEGSLACHTYCDTGNLFIMVIYVDPWHSHLLPSVKQWIRHYLFLRFRSVAAGIRTPNLPLAGTNALTHCATASVSAVWTEITNF